MSKNFELLQRAEYGRKVAPVVEFDTAAKTELKTATAGRQTRVL